MGAVKHSNTLEFSTFDSVTKEPVKICVVRVSDGVVVCPTGLSATVEEMERTPVIKIISEGKGFRALATEKDPIARVEVKEFTVIRSEIECYAFEDKTHPSGLFQNLRFFQVSEGGVALLDSRCTAVALVRIMNGEPQAVWFRKAIMIPDIPAEELLDKLSGFADSLKDPPAFPGVKVPLGVDPRNN